MSDIKLTEDQRKSVEVTGKNILVSAAAGSGKTAVLAKRIVQRIVSGDTDIDRLVVVTFTKAAASEMKAKIRKELEKELKKDPANDVLYAQITLLQDADICTIDSFCQSIIRTHFEEAGIDPNFRVAESGEEKLLKSDVFEEVIEDFYEQNDNDFYNFVNAYSGKKDDGNLEELVDKLYTSAINNPWPDEWLDEIAREYIADEKDIYDNKIIKYFAEHIRLMAADFASRIESLTDELTPENGLEKYLECALPELEMLKEIADSTDVQTLGKTFTGMEFMRLPSVSSKKCAVEIQDKFKALRNEYKKFAADKMHFVSRLSDKDLLTKEINDTKPYIDVLIRLTKEFAIRFDAAKRERNIVTFNDMEHLALNILVERKDGKNILKKAALDLKEYYFEILVDEYQDSNALQEEILEAISNGRNRYMVGDVKQSIYGFRKARPDIFIEKYNRFTTDGDEDNQKIILQKNFRSRSKVLEGTNAVFSHVMKKEFCGIGYGKEEALVSGLEYPEAESGAKIFDGDKGKICVEYIECGKTVRFQEEAEARLVAMRIKELMSSGFKVYDADLGRYRELRYRDIVILSRSANKIADEVVEVLMREGINAYAESRDSYLDTYELRPVISMLKVIDNPLDDIALASVMFSYFGGFDASELALVRSSDRDEFLYKNLSFYAESGEDESVKTKAEDLLKQINELRDMAANASVYDIIWEIIYNTGYYRYISTVNPEEKRLANLTLLLNRASDFAGTSFTGLFQFLRYIEKVKEANEEVGEVSVLSENDDVVRLMTIHKSKGLEFPVVFIMGMNKKFLFADEKQKVLYHDELGIAITDFNAVRRTKKKTVFKEAVSEKLKEDEINEELRLLYVAMTRAREKLYMVGANNKSDPEEVSVAREGADFHISEFHGIKTFFNACMSTVLDGEHTSDIFELRVTNADDIPGTEEGSFIVDPNVKEELQKADVAFDEPYPFEDEVTKKPKVTVTELKNAALTSEDDRARDYRAEYAESDLQTGDGSVSATGDEKQKSFKAQEEAINRGNAYHKLMECFDFENDDIQGQIDALVEKGFTDEKTTGAIKVSHIEDFLKSSVGVRAKQASKAGTLYREQEFMIGIPREDMTDLLLVQGVIDMYIEDDDGISIVDYKTDRVSESGDEVRQGTELRLTAGETQTRPPSHPTNAEKILINRYKEQLGYYAKALEQATGKPVKEKIIYSFELGREILV